MVGQHHLHRKVAIVGAGNLESDNALVQPMSTALQSRMKHLFLVLDLNEWLEWARSDGIDYRITSYINSKPEALYTFQPDHTDHTYAAPRTWEFASRSLKQLDSVNDPDALPMLAGDISEGVAAEFITFCKIESELPKVADIIAAPEQVRVPQDPSTMYLLCGMLGNGAKKDNIENMLKFIKRMPAEFQVVCLREVIKRHGAPLLGHPAMQKWIANAGNTLF